ncbi:hypothetical protein D1P53_001499 [Cryptococcus gattii VGV]|nr:hypothetical protein D1P53_001499 [Cryptococcus gattii VGV]
MRSPFHSIIFSRKASLSSSSSPQDQRQHPVHLALSSASSPHLVPPQFAPELPLSVNNNMGQVNGRVELETETETESRGHGSEGSDGEGAGLRVSGNCPKTAMTTSTFASAYRQRPHSQLPLPDSYCTPDSAPTITPNSHNTPPQPIPATSANKSMGLIRSHSQSQPVPSRQCCRAGTVIAPTALTPGISLVSSSSGENGAKACRADKAGMTERTEKGEQVETVESIDVKQELKAFEAMVIKAERKVGIHIDQNNQDHDGLDVGGLEGSTLNKRFRLGTMIGYKRSLATAPHATATRSPPPISTNTSNHPCQIISSSAISLRLSPGPSSSIHPSSSGNRDDTKSARSGSDKSARRAEREWLAKIATLSSRLSAGAGLNATGVGGSRIGESPFALKCAVSADSYVGYRHQYPYERERERGKSPYGWVRGPVPPRRSTTPSSIPLSSVAERIEPSLSVCHPSWTSSPDLLSLPFETAAKQLKPQTQPSPVIHTPTCLLLHDPNSISSPDFDFETSKPFPFTTSTNATNPTPHTTLHANTDSNSIANVINAKSKLGRKSFETLGRYTFLALSLPPSHSPSLSAAELPVQPQNNGDNDDNCPANGDGNENEFENGNDLGDDIQSSIPHPVSIFSILSTNEQELELKTTEKEAARQVSVAGNTLLVLNETERKVIEGQGNNDMAEQNEVKKQEVVDGDENEDEKKHDNDVRAEKIVCESEEKQDNKNTASQLFTAKSVCFPISPPTTLNFTEPTEPVKLSTPTMPTRVTRTASVIDMPTTPTPAIPTTSSHPPTPYSPVTGYILSASFEQLGWNRAVIPGSGVGFGVGLAAGLGFDEEHRRKEGGSSCLSVDPHVEPNKVKEIGTFTTIKGVEVQEREGGKEKEPNTPVTPRHPFTLGKQDSPAPPTPPTKSPVTRERSKIGRGQKSDGKEKGSGLSNVVVRQLPGRLVSPPPSSTIPSLTYASTTFASPFIFSCSEELNTTPPIYHRKKATNSLSSSRPIDGTNSRPPRATRRHTQAALHSRRSPPLPIHPSPKRFNINGGFSKANTSANSIKTDAVGTRDKFPAMKRYAPGGRGIGVDLTPGMESGVRPPKSGLPQSFTPGLPLTLKASRSVILSLSLPALSPLSLSLFTRLSLFHRLRLHLFFTINVPLSSSIAPLTTITDEHLTTIAPTLRQ